MSTISSPILDQIRDINKVLSVIYLQLMRLERLGMLVSYLRLINIVAGFPFYLGNFVLILTRSWLFSQGLFTKIIYLFSFNLLKENK